MSFRIYIYRVLKSINSDFHISRSTIDAIDDIIKTFTELVIAKASLLVQYSNKKTLSCPEIKLAWQILCKDCDILKNENISDEAVERYESRSTSSEESSRDSSIIRQRREKKCGLIFPIAMVEKYIRQQVQFHVTELAPIQLAGILQHLANVLLTYSGKETNVTITSQHLVLALEKTNIASLINLYIINTEQTETLFPKAIFSRIVRQYTDKRISADFLKYLQCYIELEYKQFMTKLNNILLHSGRQTIMNKDFDLVQHYAPSQVRADSYLNESTIKQIGQQFDIRYFREDSVAKCQNFVNDLCQQFIELANQYCQLYGGRSLRSRFFTQLLRMNNIYPIIIEKKVRKAERKVGKKADAEPEENAPTKKNEIEDEIEEVIEKKEAIIEPNIQPEAQPEVQVEVPNLPTNLDISDVED